MEDQKKPENGRTTPEGPGRMVYGGGGKPQPETARKDYSKGQKTWTDMLEWVQALVHALVFCILVFTFVGRTVGVIGPSMQQTLIQGDRLIISKLFYTPKYGDIVVLRKEAYANYPIIKRVIATEGQRVDIDFVNGIVYVDGEALDEPYINEPTYEAEDFNGEITVPEGCVFVMGDNRNRSTDSRTRSIGCVDTRYIVGKALFRITPLNKFGSIYD